jgi:hypothetical protein
MQDLKINPEYKGKTITKDLGYTMQKIEVDKLKPSQYNRVYQMGFTEIFLTDGKNKTNASNEVIENSGGNEGVVDKVQKAPARKRKPKVA